MLWAAVHLGVLGNRAACFVDGGTKLLDRFFEVVLGKKRLDGRPTKQLRLTYDASQTDDVRKRTVARFAHDADEIIRRPAIKTRRCCKKTGGFFCLRGTGGDDLHGSRLDSRLKSRGQACISVNFAKINALTFDFT